MTPQAAFEVLNRAAGVAPLPAPGFTGSEAILPTPFRVATSAAASLAFGASLAAEIWRFRGGQKQLVEVDLHAAAASLVAPKLVRRNGAPLPSSIPDSAANGFYQSADGRWLYLQGAFPHLARRMLELLNAGNSAASVLEAVARWNSLALEDAAAFLKVPVALVRTVEEWQTSVQGRVTHPPVVLKKIGEASPLRLGSDDCPLGGVRVLDVTRLLAGPAASRLLASHGADVLTVRAPYLPLRTELEFDLSAGKRQVLLDLAKPGDAETLRRLARNAHIFVDSYRPGALAGLGFSPASLAHLAPGIIHVAISAYGPDGPWAGRRGFEDVVEAATGLAAEQGAFVAARHRRPPQPELMPAPVCDMVTGYLAAAGALAALLRRIRDGGSWQVQVSLAATSAWLQSLGRIDATRIPPAFEPLAGLDQYLQSCETEDGRFEFLGPVVRMSKTPPLKGLPPDRPAPPFWASAHEEANAAETEPA